MADFKWIRGVLGMPLKIFVNRPEDEERFPSVFWDNKNEAKYKGPDGCSRCGGFGWDADWGGPYECPACKGSGKSGGSDD